MHEFLKEIYFDFCLKNDMPKHSESSPLKGYLSVDDLMHINHPLNKPQRDWLKNSIWDTLKRITLKRSQKNECTSA